MSNMRKLGICLTMVALAILALIVIMPDAYALPLTEVTDTASPTSAGVSATHTIAFTTATAGTIDSVDITFPAGFNVSTVGVGTVTNIGAGTVTAVNQVVTYAVNAAVNVNAGTAITIPLTGVVNGPIGAYSVTVKTKDALGNSIDGPTDSNAFQITSPPLAAVTDTVVPNTTGATATHTIAFTTTTPATIKSVDIVFNSAFGLSGVGVGTVTNIGTGTVTVAGRIVTYTVTTAAAVAANTVITIPLTNVVNAPAGNYNVQVATKDAASAIIDGPTASAPFAIMPVPLTAVTDTVNPNTTGVAAAHTVGFTTATTATIASVDITFPAGFDVSTVGVGAVSPATIVPGTVTVAGQVVTYTVTTPAQVAATTAITIPLTGVINGPVGSHQVTVTTKTAAGNTINGPTLSAAFNITAVPLTAVTDTPANNTAGVTTMHTVGFTTATTGTIASMDITFPAGFNVAAVGVGAVTGIGAGTGTVAGQVVTYTVTAPAGIAAGTAITIPLTGVVNAQVGSYTVTVTTRNAAIPPATVGIPINGPTASAAFNLTPAAQLQNLTDTPTDLRGRATTTHTIAFTTTTPGTIKSVDITFPAGFNVSAVGVGAVTGIGAGTKTVAGQVVTYTVTTAAAVAANTAITIPLTGVVNAVAGNYTVRVATKTAADAIIDGPTTSAQFTLTDAIQISLTQLNRYESANHYRTAIRKGTADVPILGIDITSGTTDRYWNTLTLTYTGINIGDIATSVSLYKGGTLRSISTIVGQKVTFSGLSELIAAGTTTSFTVKVNVLSGAGSREVDFSILSVGDLTFNPAAPLITLAPGNGNPDGYAFIDASPPELDTYPSFPSYMGVYDRGSKTLKLRFLDKRDPTVTSEKVQNPLVRLVWTDAIDGTPVPQVDLSKIQLRAIDNEQSIPLTGATLVWPGPKVGASDLDTGKFYTVNGTRILYLPYLPDDGFLDPGDEFPKGASALYSEVWIRLTSVQDAHVNNNIIPDNSSKVVSSGVEIEVYINGALWDAGSALGENVNPDTAPADGDCKNLIAEQVDKKIIVIGDTTPPSLVALDKKPVKFDSTTRVLTLNFTESVDSVPRTDVRLDKMYIFNYMFIDVADDPLTTADETGTYAVIDESSITNLVGATVTEAYSPALTITLAPNQRDILKGDHPQLYIDAGAIKDIVGNPIAALNANVIDNDGGDGSDEDGAIDLSVKSLKTYISDYLTAHPTLVGYGDNLIDAANVLVTPALFSSIETMYNGNPTYIVLNLIFSEEIITVLPAKITITNDKDDSPFQLSSSEFDTIAPANGIARVARFNLTNAHRNKVSYWQRDENIMELRVRLDAGAVVDAYGVSSEAITQSKRIGWVEDTSGPLMTNSSTYDQPTRSLKLRFDEYLDLTPEGDETIDNLVDSSKITLGGGSVSSFILTNDELVSNQTDNWWLEYTLTMAHNDEVSKWWAAGVTQITISVSNGAVKDISNRNLALGNTGVITNTNWTRDNVKPTFVAAYYSKDLRSLVLRFSESVSKNANTLANIKVHSAATDPVALGADAKIVEPVSDTLKITGLDNTAHNAIANVGNPQVDILAGAVSDLAGNTINAFLNRTITSDVGGPSLITTGSIYEHIWDETKIPPNQGKLTLTFDEIVDVSTIDDLEKIKLEAGTTSIPLIGAKVLNPEIDSTVVSIEITDEETVGKVAGLQRDFYPNLFVRLAAGAVEDLAGNSNVEKYQAIEKWIGDTKQPELDYTHSYYIHDYNERGTHYARLVLKFNEIMDTTSGYINFSGIVIANPAGTSITLTAAELKPNQGLSNEMQFNLTADHRDTISDWGKPKATVAGAGPSYTEAGMENLLHIYLAENSVSDRAGNSVLVKPVQKFATSADDPDPSPYPAASPVDRSLAKYRYDSTLAADSTKVVGTDYSTWEKDLIRADYVSSTYNANDKMMTITFNESMDQAPPADTVQPELITIKDKDELNPVDLMASAAEWFEQAKTTTVKFRLTAEKDAAVKARANDVVGQTPGKIYMYLTQGVAVDYSGLGSAATTTKKEITYTRDTTKPTLSVSDDAAGSTYDHKYGVDLADSDELGVLTLFFSEAVDKNYDAIDAGKIRLSNQSSGGGFALTQAEILKAAGNRVYPLAAGSVNQIQFDLNAAHWDVIAKEKWGVLYIQMDAGAVKDVSGNAIVTVSALMADGRYHRDVTPPDVRLPDVPIATAPVGNALIITATVTDDIQIQEVRLYYQPGGAVRTYVNMTASGSTYTGTIPGTAVTNKGLCYYVWANDQAGNDNVQNGQGAEPNTGNVKTRKGNLDEWHYTSIPGGFPVKVTGASVQLPANTLPVFDAAAVPSTYRMLSVPITASPSSTTLFTPFGTAGNDWTAWKFTGGPENNGYQAGHITPFSFSPGVAAWVGTVNPDKVLTVTGDTSQISNFYHQSDVTGKRYKYEIKLQAGWNQVGIPFNYSVNWDGTAISFGPGATDIKDTIYWFTGEKGAYSFASLDSNVPNQDVFATSWKGSGIPDNSLVWNGWPGSLDPWGGYWIYSNREGAILYIDPTVPGKGVLPTTPAAPSVQMPYNWSVKIMPEAGGISGTAKFAGIVSDATDGIDQYDVMDLPALPGQIARLSFITEVGDYLQDMKAPADEMFWNFKVSSAVNTPVTLKFDASAVPSEYRTVLLIDTVTDATTDLRKASSYAYKPSDTLRNFKLIISKAHIETYIVPKHSVLLQNYPNPFNPETWVPYRLSTAGDVTINIYNVAGQLVRTLELGHREAGSYTFKERAAYWDGRNVTGERVASGVYFYHIQSGSFHAIKRMVIVK